MSIWDRFQPPDEDIVVDDEDNYYMERCAECHEYVRETYAGLCPRCQSDALKDFRYLFNQLSEAQRYFINEYFEGKEIE